MEIVSAHGSITLQSAVDLSSAYLCSTAFAKNIDPMAGCKHIGLQRVAIKLDDGASFEDESVFARPQGEDRLRLWARDVQGAGRAHFRSRRHLG